MTVHIFRTRMAMHGNHYAYDGLVSTDQLDRSRHNHFVIRDSREYVTFADATRPAALDAMELGWDRYQAWQDHEKAAHTVLLRLAQSIYPELAPASRWPQLWCEIPALDAQHDRRTIELSEVAK